MFSKPIRLKNNFQNYDWGTFNEIPRILGMEKPNTELPLAELWVGAHPKSPSFAVDEDQPLDALIASNPIEILGENASKMGNKLPYLFKILSARKALSIQVHPTKAQAVEGYTQERKNDIEGNHAQCNYQDDNHKPELIYALTKFSAMAGFRPNRELAKSLRLLQHEQFDQWADTLAIGTSRDVEAFYGWLLHLDLDLLKDLVEHALDIAKTSEVNELKWLESLYQLYGIDLGIFFPLILNLFELKPGQALFLGAGCPHAYLQGTGIEIMANSDNVLRGGLTSKHMDRKELVKITQYTEQANCIHPQLGELTQHVRSFEIPCPDFQFELINLKNETHYITSSSASAELYFVVEGQCEILGECYQQGESFLMPSALKAAVITGQAQIGRVYTQF
ncbi:mannose-6-phosphate isomerase, class I [Catenovulum adriaticum]|uniref:mannose-6-phosphate isomerase n=1 Tax=Catenovulum adriaticum TaxID=2984846 RepID=A0ABY7AMP8_9ALTE|nr:mannose-6-phosphate isomerase, class I [Catenovulum sp. TS8]WAJ70590.1 mannose-6-phosphate isomerase, class I [Catenovulum sp. TS8]